MTLFIVLSVAVLFQLIVGEEISRHEFLVDELEQKLELLKYDLKSIEKYVSTNLLYQNDLDNSTETEYDYEDYGEPEEGVEEEDYNYEYEDYDYSEGSTDIESGEGEASGVETAAGSSEEAVTQPAIAPGRTGRLLKHKNLSDVPKSSGSKQKKSAKKGKKQKKSKKQKKGKKGKKAKKVKKQKGLSAGGSNTKRTTGVNLTPEQIKQICSSQPGSGSGLRGINQGEESNPNEFAKQFKQLTQSFNQLQSALQTIRKSSSSSVPSGSSGQPPSVDNRGTDTDQDQSVGPLVQAALGAQSAAANALRGLLPGGQSSLAANERRV